VDSFWYQPLAMLQQPMHTGANQPMCRIFQHSWPALEHIETFFSIVIEK
jgi:hypothetical protein